jgi:hypothetical protein
LATGKDITTKRIDALYKESRKGELEKVSVKKVLSLDLLARESDSKISGYFLSKCLKKVMSNKEIENIIIKILK